MLSKVYNLFSYYFKYNIYHFNNIISLTHVQNRNYHFDHFDLLTNPANQPAPCTHISIEHHIV
ncbi:hypothetical protein Hanom_Chr13g01245111 [Helianthus anomalus]